MTNANENPRGLPVVQRWNATGDYAYPAEEADDGEFVSYEEYAALLAELDALRADAARYRWLRDRHDRTHQDWHVRDPLNNAPEIGRLDTAIDAAISAMEGRE